MNWRKRKKLWKRSHAWLRQNGSNRSLHTMERIINIPRPRWSKS